MNYLLLAFALLHGALLLWSFRRGNGNSPRLWLLRFMLLGMCYDNLVQGTGNWFIGADWYQAAYPIGNPVVDPTGPASGSNRVFRGGSWYYGESILRSARRNFNAPGTRDTDIGFRVGFQKSQ